MEYGLYVLSSRKDERFNGMIANGITQVSSVPANFVISVNKKNLTHEFIKKSRVLSFAILSRDTPLSFIGRFGFNSGRELDKFKGVNYKVGKTGAPVVLDNALGYLELKVINELDAGTHTIFVGELVEAETLKSGEPMTYAYYHVVKRGTAPKAAPTYIEEKKAVKLAKYQCTVCGYIYDPEKGDPDGGIAPGTPFEELPDDWVCPVCGAEKDRFEKIEG